MPGRRFAGRAPGGAFPSCRRRTLRLLFPVKAFRFPVRQKMGAENSGFFFEKAPCFLMPGKQQRARGARLKNVNSNANNWQIHIFHMACPDFPQAPACGPGAVLCPVGPGTRLRAQNGKAVAFSVARETARMASARSHALCVTENGIWNSAAGGAPVICRGKCFCATTFPHARGAKHKPVCGPETPSRPAPSLLEGCRKSRTLAGAVSPTPRAGLLQPSAALCAPAGAPPRYTCKYSSSLCRYCAYSLLSFCRPWPECGSSI